MKPSLETLSHLTEQEKICLKCWQSDKCENFRKIENCRFATLKKTYRIIEKN